MIANRSFHCFETYLIISRNNFFVFRSGYALIWLSWIRIQIRTGNSGLHPGVRKLTKMNKQTWKYVHKVYFSWQNLTFCDGKVWSGWGSAWNRISLAPWIRFRIEGKSWIRIRIQSNASAIQQHRLTFIWTDIVIVAYSTFCYTKHCTTVSN